MDTCAFLLTWTYIDVANPSVILDLEAESAHVPPKQFIVSDVPSDVQEVQVSRS